jgi:Dolichyl-phosphate-mannose-protein mannosyltransferase
VPLERSFRRALLLDTAVVLLLTATLVSWFAAWPAFVPAALPAGALVTTLAFRWGAAPPRPRWPRIETLACLLLAILYRFQALLEPWGFVNKDGAYGAFVALHLQQGVRPAPVFTEGANYQGTLKGHLAVLISLVSGVRDLSWLIVAASLVLYLVFVAASVALARRLGGRTAAWVTGIYLAISPRFLTVFSLNSVGQYVDILALGGVALALLARIVEEPAAGSRARSTYLALGLLLGAAFWQQPVALAYWVVAFVVLALRRETWRDPWAALVGVGLLLGVLPVLIWNFRNDWDSSFILGREPSEVQAQIAAIPVLAERAVMVAFPVLAGLSPRHPWGGLGIVKLTATALLPALLVAYLVLKVPEIARSLRQGRPSAALLPPLLMAACLALFWSVAAGMVYKRPRYLLPVLAASAIHLGVVAAWAWRRPRGRVGVVAVMAGLLAFAVIGTVPRFGEAQIIAADYRRLLGALDRLQIRTAYSDFSISAPVTMFTRERILVSPRLGPTPAYESEALASRVDRAGPDAFILPSGDDPELFASELRRHGVDFKTVLDPLPIFYDLHPRIRAEEVRGFRGEAPSARPGPDE